MSCYAGGRCDCRNNDVSTIGEMYSFCVDHVAYGQHCTHDLKPGGRHIVVTEHNKREYTQSVERKLNSLVRLSEFYRKFITFKVSMIRCVLEWERRYRNDGSIGIKCMRFVF